ncbi:MAG: uroporphyrinogen decarboxylase family protein [Anaerolineales bacterium]
MNHRQRLEAVVAGEKPDRVPVALWRHFPVDDQSLGNLAGATVDFQRAYDFDLVKVTPASSFCIKDWGVQDVWRGASEGTREYTVHVIQHPEDWERLPVLDPYKGYLGAQLECLRLIVHELGPDVPVIQTIFSPLAQAKNLVGGGGLLVHLRKYPQALQIGLNTIAESTIRFIEAMQSIGIAGLFYAVQHARFSLLSLDEYRAFGGAYDQRVLEPAKAYWLKMLHLHGEEVMFDYFTDYPVDIINWHDRDTAPDLADGQNRFQWIVCGGLQRERTMELGTPEQVTAEARQAIQATGGRRFILGTGCVTPITAPRANLLAARRIVEELT